MRSFLTPVAGLTCALALAVTGCSSDSAPASGSPDGSASAGREAAGQDGAGQAASSGSATSYAPYVSATGSSAGDAAGDPRTYNLAFVVSDGSGCTPKWNGVQSIGDSGVKSRVSSLKQNDATVRVSFGGALGKELALSCDSAAALAAAYGKALDAAGSSQADFDIEGNALTDSGSVALRSEAIARLQQERPGLKVSFTLPVMPSGLDAGGLAVLDSAHEHDVQVSSVNIMTMNYGESYAGDMGGYALTAAKATHAQLRKVFGLSDTDAWRGMALTSMIGVNDVAGETFTLADAAEVRSFAEEKEIGWVSMWSTFRDRQCEAGEPGGDDAATDCSGVKQSSGAFGRTFAG